MTKYGEYVRKRGKRIYEQNRQNLLEYRLQHPCINCGESDPVCLDFHHINPKDKSFPVTDANRNWEQLHTEIQKCVMLCANCHRKYHAGKIKLKL